MATGKEETTSRPKRIPIKVYRQSTGYTCGAACLLAILNCFDPERYHLFREAEMDIHSRTYYGRYGEREGFHLEYLSSAYPGLALYALERGFSAILFQERERFPRVTGLPGHILSDMQRIYNKYLREALARGLELRTGEFGIPDLLKEIDKGRPSILLVETREGGVHNIVLRGYKNDRIYVMDPLEGYRVWTMRELEDCVRVLETGRFALCVWK